MRRFRKRTSRDQVSRRCVSRPPAALKPLTTGAASPRCRTMVRALPHSVMICLSPSLALAHWHDRRSVSPREDIDASAMPEPQEFFNVALAEPPDGHDSEDRAAAAGSTAAATACANETTQLHFEVTVRRRRPGLPRHCLSRRASAAPAVWFTCGGLVWQQFFELVLCAEAPSTMSWRVTVPPRVVSVMRDLLKS